MTIGIIVITAAISILAFNRQDLFNRLQFNPYLTLQNKQWYRLISHGLIHAGWLHLIINMLVLWMFGSAVEDVFHQLYQANWMQLPVVNFILLYAGGIVVSSLLTLKKHRDNINYNSVGASGAVSAVVFISIFFDPWRKIYFYGIIGLPGIVLGLIYLAYSYYMGKRGDSYINHDAHFVGAVYGFVFPVLIDIDMVRIFLDQLLG